MLEKVPCKLSNEDGMTAGVAEHENGKGMTEKDALYLRVSPGRAPSKVYSPVFLLIGCAATATAAGTPCLGRPPARSTDFPTATFLLSLYRSLFYPAFFQRVVQVCFCAQL